MSLSLFVLLFLVSLLWSRQTEFTRQWSPQISVAIETCVDFCVRLNATFRNDMRQRHSAIFLARQAAAPAVVGASEMFALQALHWSPRSHVIPIFDMQRPLQRASSV